MCQCKLCATFCGIGPCANCSTSLPLLRPRTRPAPCPSWVFLIRVCLGNRRRASKLAAAPLCNDLESVCKSRVHEWRLAAYLITYHLPPALSNKANDESLNLCAVQGSEFLILNYKLEIISSTF